MIKISTAVLTVVIVVVYALGSGRWVSTGGDWYSSLERPPWQPPDAAFGLAWTYNFVVIIVAGIVVAMNGSDAQRGVWLLSLTVSVAAALLWAWLFYERHALWPSSFALLLATLITVPLVISAWGVRVWAGAILLPYQCWLAIATSLAFGYAQRNPA